MWLISVKVNYVLVYLYSSLPRLANFTLSNAISGAEAFEALGFLANPSLVVIELTNEIATIK